MIFLKLGGSLITDKARPETSRPEVLARIGAEIAAARQADLGLRLLVGHGSGSFGHPAASRYGTYRGASTPDDWLGFAVVWQVANQLHRLVVDSLRQAGLPAMSFPPSASAVTEDGALSVMSMEPLARALEAGLLPVVAGDVAFDRRRGSTIISTERIFSYLAPFLRPTRLLLAGIEPGVLADYPAGDEILPWVGLSHLTSGKITGAATTDVTGGMAEKVRHALSLVEVLPDLEIRIFSGAAPGAIRRALAGEAIGTLVRAE